MGHMRSVARRLPDLGELPNKERERLGVLQGHLHQLVYGCEFEEGVPPGVPMLSDQAVSAAITALAGDGICYSPRHVRRLAARYRELGVAGLVDYRLARVDRPLAERHPQIASLLAAELKTSRRRSTTTRKQVIEKVRLQATVLHLACPSSRTLYRLLDELDRTDDHFGLATTRRSQDRRPKRSFSRISVNRPGEIVEIDSTPLDVLALCPDGTTLRPELTIGVDVATQSICAGLLTAGPLKGVDASSLLLVKMMRRPEDQPGWTAQATRLGLIDATAPNDDEATLEDALRAKPLIVPESITVDRGRVFVGGTFLQACERLQISFTEASPLTPTDKPHVERTFRSIATQFTEYLDGHLGSSVSHRGEAPESEAAWPLADLQQLFDEWVAVEWQQRPHAGLRVAGMPQCDLSPNEMFAALAAMCPTVPPVITNDDLIALLPRVWRRVNRYGINLHRLTYDSDELSALRLQDSGLGGEARGRWEVRYDPYRAQQVWIHDHRNDRWIEARWVLASQRVAPFSLDVLRAAKKVVEDRAGQPPTEKWLLKRIQTVQSRRETASPTERRAERRGLHLAPSGREVSPPAPVFVPEPVARDRTSSSALHQIPRLD